MRPKLLIALGAVAAVVLLGVFVAGPLLWSEDGMDDPPAAAATGDADDRDRAPAGSDGDAGAEDAEPDPVDETFEVFTARDPFQQLASDDGHATPASTGTEAGDNGGEGIASADDGDDGEDGGDESTPSGASVGGTTVELIEVFEDADGTETVHVTVNGTGYEVTEGDDFASRFRVLDVTGQCATFLFGDQRFTLCEGETIRK